MLFAILILVTSWLEDACCTFRTYFCCVDRKSEGQRARTLPYETLPLNGGRNVPPLHPPPARDFQQCVIDLDCVTWSWPSLAVIQAMKSRVLVYFSHFYTLKVGIAKEKGLKSEVRSECLVLIIFYKPDGKPNILQCKRLRFMRVGEMPKASVVWRGRDRTETQDCLV